MCKRLGPVRVRHSKYPLSQIIIHKRMHTHTHTHAHTHTHTHTHWESFEMDQYWFKQEFIQDKIKDTMNGYGLINKNSTYRW